MNLLSPKTWFKNSSVPNDHSHETSQLLEKIIASFDYLNFPDSQLETLLKKLCGILSLDGLSILLVNSEKNHFVTQSWVGEKPLSMSVASRYEFLAFLKRYRNLVFKKDVQENPNFAELRQVGLYYFTQLSCDAVMPMIIRDEWVGLINIGKTKQGQASASQIVCYQFLAQWFSRYFAHLKKEEELSHQKLKLKEISELKSQMMANVTHELRTPLNGILGLTHLLLEGGDGALSDEQRRHLDMILKAGENLLEVINNILSLMKVEALRGELQAKKIDLSYVVAEVSQIFEGVLVQKSNRLVSHIPSKTFVYANDDQLRTVLMNLIGNASKFTQQGSIEILCFKSGEMLKVCVKDSGIGIDPESQLKIFEEFQQADGSITRAYGGTGLGLAIAKKIVELHGGRIWVESVPGRGASFYFTLPLRPAGLLVNEKT